MKLIITASIQELEFKPLEKIFTLKVILEAGKKSLKGLGEKIKGSSKIPSTELQKVYLTSSQGAGRVIFLIQINSKKSVLVMIRHKNDKQIGANMTVKNPKFKKILKKNLDMILKDIQAKKYEEYTIDA